MICGLPPAQLGGEVAMIESVRLSALDSSVAHVANASTVVPSWRCSACPTDPPTIPAGRPTSL